VSATYRHCRHCGDTVPHDAPAAICGRCACLTVAERGRGMPPPIPGSGLGLPPIGGSLTASDWGRPIAVRKPGSDDKPVSAPAGKPAPETEQARRERLHQARVAHVRAEWIRGRRCLLARALDPMNRNWCAIEPRGK